MKNSKIIQTKLSSGPDFDRLFNQFYKLTGQKAEGFYFPGLKGRSKSGSGSTLAMTKSGKKLIMTFRHNVRLAELEAEVLENLSKLDAPVPRLVARAGQWLVQEYLGELRLTQALNTESPEIQKTLMEKAICSLAKIQDIGRQASLHQRVLPVCTHSEWRRERVNFPQVLGEILKIPSPPINKEALYDALIVEPNTFVKWDARAGNAIVQKDGTISWFDWEHCGCRTSVDDLVWFLSDEWMPTNGKLDEDIIEKNLSLFKSSKLKVSVKRYLYLHGTLHMCGRLTKILNLKGTEKWWNRNYCLEFEQMGVTLTESSKLAKRASNWASCDRLTAPLSVWLHDVDAKLKEI